ncbi:hypothetical protein F4821DRAFT_221555 [Hypoxylon rubiginosum]|uniref:Uncharacterized protein n=1 Tax=Hypoxylon rubiginosum TaxID=110542 RepID=A0ACC0DP19_9PEZI|nr:hypothetical protein F4821DRAFT_221555 [Hypoxylon rubiginosum]
MMTSNGYRVQWADGYYQSAHVLSARQPVNAVDRRRRESDATAATGNHRYPDSHAPLPGPEIRSQIDSDVPLALVPGSEYGIGGSLDYEHQERSGQELHLWSGTRVQRDPGPPFNPPTSALDYIRPGPSETVYESFPRWESLLRWEDKPYVSGSFRLGETSRTTPQMQTTLPRNPPPSPVSPFADFDGDFTALSRPATPAGPSSYEVSDLSDFDLNTHTFTPSPTSSDRIVFLGPSTPISPSSAQVSDLSDFDVNRPTFTPSSVSFTLPPTSGSNDNSTS